MTAPYRVTRQGETHETELIYKFEEDVFHPEVPAAQNLADMMAVQVALNYGLSVRRLFLSADLTSMISGLFRIWPEIPPVRSTSRNFWNPIPCKRRGCDASHSQKESYLRAKPLFQGDDGRFKNLFSTRMEKQEGAASRYAVLSSGGKDSLLSYGLLNEMGLEVHPIFVNESGRHWFTALNAYRHFRDDIPFTSRVWTNSDRVFNWMLRHLPFIRKDLPMSVPMSIPFDCGPSPCLSSALCPYS